MLDTIEIAKPVELQEYVESTSKLPSKERELENLDTHPRLVPHGLCMPHILVDIITNHRRHPSYWNVARIADKTRLRPEDVENFLKYFELIDEQANRLLPEDLE